MKIVNPTNIDIASVRECLDYSPETGQLVWKKLRTGSNRKIGDVAGHIQPLGYVTVRVLGKAIQAHRLIWFWVTGEWPDCEIDHRNGKRSDNRWENLRVVTRAENMQNQRNGSRRSALGLLGVSRHGMRFRARINDGEKRRALGVFATADEAHAAYINAKRQLHAGCTL